MKDLLVILNIPELSSLDDVKQALVDIYLPRYTGHVVFASSNEKVLLEIRENADEIQLFMLNWSNEVLHITSSEDISNRINNSEDRYLLLSDVSYSLENNVVEALLVAAQLNRGFGYIYPHQLGYDKYLANGSVYDDKIELTAARDLSKMAINIDYSPSEVFLTTPRNYLADKLIQSLRGIGLRRLGMASILLPHTTIKKRETNT